MNSGEVESGGCPWSCTGDTIGSGKIGYFFSPIKILYLFLFLTNSIDKNDNFKLYHLLELGNSNCNLLKAGNLGG